MFTKLVFERLNDRELTSGQPKILEYLQIITVLYKKTLLRTAKLNRQQ